MPLDRSQVKVAANGRVYSAPLGTAGPTSATNAMPAGWIDLGYLSEDAFTVRSGREIAEIRGWQSSNSLRRIVTSTSFDVSFSLMQWSSTTVRLAFGGGTVTQVAANATATPPIEAHALYTPPDPETIDERQLCLELRDGVNQLRWVITNGSVTDDVEIGGSRTDPSLLPITFSANASDVGQPWYFRTNFPGILA